MKNTTEKILKYFLIFFITSLLLIGIYIHLRCDYNCKIIDGKIKCDEKKNLVFDGVEPEINDDCDKLLYRLKRNINYKDRQPIWRGIYILCFFLILIVYIVYKINKNIINTYSMIIMLTLFFFAIYKYEIHNEFHINMILKEFGDDTISLLYKKCIKNI